jgi:excisionase family DNA binding protein
MMARADGPVNTKGQGMAREGTLTVSIEEAGAALGIGRQLAYRLARENALPVPVLRVGRRLLVPRAALMRLLEGVGAGAEQARE